MTNWEYVENCVYDSVCYECGMELDARPEDFEDEPCECGCHDLV